MAGCALSLHEGSCMVPSPRASVLGSNPQEAPPMADQPESRPRRGTVSRRSFLRAAGVTGAVALGPTVLRNRALAQETPSPVRPDPSAKRGGTLKYGILSAAAHFDVHQSGTVANIGPQS